MRTFIWGLGFGCAAVLGVATPHAAAADPMFASAKDCGLAGVKMNCRVWEPNNYKPGTKYPLIVYLHGAGQAGYSSDSAENERVIQNTRNWARLYAIGSSMGGFGTWDLIARNPTLFAAGLPNAGGGPPDAAVGLRNMAIWSHHNDGDGSAARHRCNNQQIARV